MTARADKRVGGGVADIDAAARHDNDDGVSCSQSSPILGGRAHRALAPGRRNVILKWRDDDNALVRGSDGDEYKSSMRVTV